MMRGIVVGVALASVSIALAKGEVSVGVAKGWFIVIDEYEYHYTAFSAKISYEVVPHVALGLKADWEDPLEVTSAPFWLKGWALTPSLVLNSRFVALEAGPALFFQFPGYFHSTPIFYPSGYLRLGPEDLIFLTGSVFSESPPVYGGMAIRIGVGTVERFLPTKTKLWFGVGGYMGAVFMGRVEQKITRKFTAVLSGDFGLGYGLGLGVQYGF